MSGKETFLTDGGHFIADINAGKILYPEELDQNLRQIPGIIENGLFINLVNKVVAANEKTVNVITYR